jgi:preprotein translocase subunit SecD
VPPLTGEYLISVSRENDDQRGIVVRFQFNSEGGRLLSDLTTKNAGGQMAIVLDDQVQSAPNVLDPITGGGGIIHGNYTAEEVDRMVTMLRSGALPATLKPMPVSEVTVEPRK